MKCNIECMLWTLSLVLCLTEFTNGTLSEDITKYTPICCQKGTEFALSSQSESGGECSAVIPPDDDVPKTIKPMCKLVMEECCKDAKKEVTSCDAGKLYAKDKKCYVPTESIGQSCCEECSLGYLAGLNGKAACSRASSEEEELIPSIMLRKKAFKSCCLEKAKEKAGDEKSNEEINSSTSATSREPSVCEQYAPNELCAHHCIPLPGSFKCECNPGFVLMPDKTSCMLQESNKCLPKNPCEHKCIDTGKDIKCTCKRGYRLNKDRKTCRDINECIEEKNTCPENTKCINTEGAFKCLQVMTPKTTTTVGSTRGKCPVGYIWNSIKSVCDDINECENPVPPCPPAYCTNTVGSFMCKGGVRPVPLDSRSSAENRCPNGFEPGQNEECIDIDECLTGDDDCNKQSQTCLNTHGSFVCHEKASKTCPAGFKTNKVTSTCQDIDECLEAAEVCRDDETCVNVPGEYQCKPGKRDSPHRKGSCGNGLQLNAITNSCEDIDECEAGNHICDQYQKCINTYGGHQCQCKVGFELDPKTMACVDIDECQVEEMNKCNPQHQRCDNTVGSYSCVRITSCGTGYVLQTESGKCQDIDECAKGLHNCGLIGSGYVCVNKPGTFRCEKKRPPTTTTVSPDEYEYYDEDEVVPDLTTNEINPPTSTTTSITEKTVTQSPKYQVPKPSSTLPAPPNHTPKQEAATPTQESVTPVNDVYETTPPEITVTRKPFTSTDTRKPVTRVTYATEPRIVTLPNPGRSTAAVTGTRTRDGSIAVDTKNVPENTWTVIAGPNAKEDDRSNEKHCIAGYIMNSNGDCVDIDECTQGTHDCSRRTEKCLNIDGGFKCECADGFTKDLKTGWCTFAASTASTPSRAPSSTQDYPPPLRPFNRFRWSQCDIGYFFNSSTAQCEDVDECARGIATCGIVEICENTQGGYKCVCPPKWKLDPIKHRCIPATKDPAVIAREYSDPPPMPRPDSARPDNTVTIGRRYGGALDGQMTPESGGLDVKTCPWGYRLNDEKICVDVDECLLGTSNCGPKQICTNQPGGYVCECAPGHQMIGSNDCVDIDECALSQGRFCSKDSDCINTEGSFLCRCHEGLRPTPTNDKVCADINECEENRPGTLCEHSCNNVWKSYVCSCHRGYKLQADNRTCVDVDECKVYANKGLCVGKCYNEPGSYRCGCPPGYRLSEDKRSCIDIDECETGEATCANAGPSIVCQNTRGSYKCHRITCPPGYQLTDNKPRCTLIDKTCRAGDWACAKRPSTFSYNFISFVSNLYIPPPPQNRVDLFTMRGPQWPGAKLQFTMKLIRVNHPPSVLHPADMSCFEMTPSSNQAFVSLKKSLEGPQSIHLELTMELYTNGAFGGSAVANIIIYVSEYTF